MKKILAAILVVFLLIPIVTTTANAQSTDLVVTDTVNAYKYHYEDAYFYNNASTYNPSLSTMSFCLAMSGSANSSDDWSHQYYPQPQVLLCNELGFTDFDVNEDYKVIPGMDTMGVAIAHREIVIDDVDYTLIAVVPRSQNYYAEWASDFTLGLNGNLQGISEAAQKVEDFIQEYAEKYGKNFKDNIKVWLTGFSRGAGVANLVAGHLTESGKFGTYSISKEHIYAYTFEAPRSLNTSVVSLSKAKSFTNIHNIITPNDPVTKIAPAQWGFIRYGTDESVIPEVRTSENAALFEESLKYLPSYYSRYLFTYDTDGKARTGYAMETFQAKKLKKDAFALAKLGKWVKTGDSYKWEWVDSETAKTVLLEDADYTLSEAWDNLVNDLAIGFGSREQYVDAAQSIVRFVITEMEADNYQTKVLEIAQETLKKLVEEQKQSLIMAAITLNEAYLTKMLTDIAEEVIEVSGMDARTYGKMAENLLKVIPTFVKVILTDVTLYGGSTVISFIENFEIVTYPHYPEQCYGWLCAQDKNYNSEGLSNVAAVSDVAVEVKPVTVVHRFLFFKRNVTKYIVTITPTAGKEVQKVEYRTLLIGKLKEGSSFVSKVKVPYLYIAVTDANGNVTHWTYKNQTVKISK